MPNPNIVSPAQKRLRTAHRRLKTWRAVAAEISTRTGIKINVRYVYDLGAHGVEPPNETIRRALGLHRRPAPKPAARKPAWVKEAADNLTRLLAANPDAIFHTRTIRRNYHSDGRKTSAAKL